MTDHSHECPGPGCATALLEWLRDQALLAASLPRSIVAQGSLFHVVPYNEEAPAVRSDAELAGAVEHLEYAVFRRRRNQLTRAERSRLENSIENALFKAERYLASRPTTEGATQIETLRAEYRETRELGERQRQQARRAEARLAQLDRMTPDEFEEFVAELFEALGFQVEQVGGTGDEGIDLRVERRGLIGIVQCKYHKRGVIGSPDLQRFLGSIRHARGHTGYFVTTRTFSLAAEKFAAEHPIELIDGPRLVELVHDALGSARRSPEDPQPLLTLWGEETSTSGRRTSKPRPK